MKETAPWRLEGEIKCKQRSVRGMRVCISVCVRVCVVFCLPCLIMRLHAHKGKSQTGDTPNQTSHGRNRRGTRRATSCYAVGQPFFMIIIFIFYLFTCAFDRVDSRCLPCLSTCVCVCVRSNLMAFYAAADQLKTADLARCAL